MARPQKKKASFDIFGVDDAKYSSSRNLVLVEWSCEIFLEEGEKKKALFDIFGVDDAKYSSSGNLVCHIARPFDQDQIP